MPSRAFRLAEALGRKNYSAGAFETEAKFAGANVEEWEGEVSEGLPIKLVHVDDGRNVRDTPEIEPSLP